MRDVERVARERAERPRAQVGANFESARQREKRALVKQLDSLDGSKIRKIAALSDTPDEQKIQNVAAYCRVSTDDIDQKVSITLQIRVSKENIQANPNWKYVGTYVDDGFSGTNTEHRPGFQKLMSDALDGKIDKIITKSVSRFARNLTDCIGWVETLQNHDPPISVFFEQENLDTLSQSSSIILFVLAMVAQEESHMKSEAILLSLEWRFSRGRFLTPRLFGYDRVEVPDGFGGKKKVLSVNETEARVVRWMYATVLNGGTAEDIAKTLTELAIPTGGRRKNGALNTHWTSEGVIAAMRNEKHCGDVLARKTYTPNYKDHKKKKNNGKKNKYYQPEHHEAIVSRAVWNAAQRILNSRRYGHEGTYLPMMIIDHGTLTGYISMNPTWAGFDYEDYYRASQIAMGMLDEELETDISDEYLPEAGHKIGGLVDDHGIAQIARELTQAEQEIRDELEGRDRTEDADTDGSKNVKTFQVVSGEMFSRIHEPVMRITKNGFTFNTNCVSKLQGAKSVEILYNPVERMLIVRPCDVDHPNAVDWDKKYKSAAPLCRILYDSMGWENGYSFRVPCQAIMRPGAVKAGHLTNTANTVLAFDLDNYVGRTSAKKDEVIIAQKIEKDKADEAKSYFYPPDDDEPQEIQEIQQMEERFQEAVEINRKTFGTPVFQHTAELRSLEEGGDKDGDWDMLVQARPLDISHRIDGGRVDRLLSEIIEDPPVLPQSTEEKVNEIIIGKEE